MKSNDCLQFPLNHLYKMVAKQHLGEGGADYKKMVRIGSCPSGRET